MTGMDHQDLDTIVGWTDGFRKGYIEGWAWRPNRPHDTVVVQLFVDGVLAGEASACLPRPDLSTAGIGHGQHAFAIPLLIEPDAPPVMHLTVRAKDGPVLPSGEIDFATSEQTRAELALRRSVDHLEKVFGPITSNSARSSREMAAEPAPHLHFVLYASRGHAAASAVLGAPEYSYVFVLRGFREILRQLGIVHIVQDPAGADGIFAACLERGESCLLFSFTPPQNTPLGLRCPTIPVIAWEFGSIPTGGWPGDWREDWRYVLRQTGRAITISGFAARAIRATMGAEYPVAVVPTPVWDRQARLRSRLAGPDAVAPGGPVTLSFDGFTWDSRHVTLSAAMHAPPPVIAKPEQPAALPMRGAQLALAQASAQASAEANAQAQARAEARAQADAAGQEIDPAPPDASNRPGRRLLMTALLARQWYRDVLRDRLPPPIARGLSRAGRALLRSRAALAPASGGPASVGPASGGDVPYADPEPPPTARYLPVGDPGNPVSATAPPRYLPAPDQPPLPEPELADFSPDPYPRAPAAASRRATATLEGLIFTAVLSPKDGRKNWQDILTAFCTMFRATGDATLVLKMIGNDPAFWWWEFHDIVRALPPFACRVLVINGFLDDPAYADLIAATHFVVNASLAEGQCLPLVEFMSAARPAIAPLHTAMLDYITPDNALIVASDVEFCSFPHDPRNMLTTTRYRIEWPSLCAAFAAAAGIVRDNPVRYAALAENAASSMRAYCSDATAGRALAGFLGLGDEVQRRAGWQPRAAAAAEPLLSPPGDGLFGAAEALA